MKIKLFLSVLFLLSLTGQANAQNYFQDTVWTKMTDQSLGFFQVKFSPNDSIIAGNGLSNVLFFNALSGNEYGRIDGNNEIFFINNSSFIKLNEDSKRLEIFDVNTLQIIDTLANDGKSISKYAAISNNLRYYVSTTNDGLRVWDILSKSIVKEKMIEKEPELLSWGTGHLWFNCDDTKIIVSISKTLRNPNNPNEPIKKNSLIVFDFQTLDSLTNLESLGDYKISNTCKYIAYKVKNPDFGVEVYDFNTKELLWKIPVNGPSLTGIEFSPDDKYLVTSSGPSANNIKIWDITKNEKVYEYLKASFMNIGISHGGKYIVTSVGESLKLLYARWNGTNIEEGEINPIIIYPNPTNGFITLNFNQQLPEITNINLNDINGITIRNLFNNFLEPGQQALSFDVNDLANGEYFISVNNLHLSLFFKLVVNR